MTDEKLKPEPAGPPTPVPDETEPQAPDAPVDPSDPEKPSTAPAEPAENDEPADIDSSTDGGEVNPPS